MTIKLVRIGKSSGIDYRVTTDGEYFGWQVDMPNGIREMLPIFKYQSVAQHSAQRVAREVATAIRTGKDY